MKRPMRRFRLTDYPVTCQDCGGLLRYDADRFAWVHQERGADHAPRISGLVQR